jgi:hypothetical protein
MSLGSFLRHWFRRPNGRGAGPDRRFAARLGVEHLEDRCVPTLMSGISVFQPGSATWYLHNSPAPGAPDVAPFAYGGGDWIPVAGDWNGDGQVTVGVYDPHTATWYLKNDNHAGAPSVTPFRYGEPGWIPVVGDWAGSGRDGIGVFDPATGTWYLRNEATAGAPDAGQFRFGAPGWLPVVGDWDGNGTTTIGAFDPIGQFGKPAATWYLRNSNSAGAPDVAPFAYGAPGWVPVAGDWDGNGTTTVGVFDPGFATWYLRDSNSVGAPDVAPFAYGGRGWSPLALVSPASHNPGNGSPPPGAPQITLQVPATAAGNSFTAAVTVRNDPSVNASTAFTLDVDLNHDGRFDGPGESGYAAGTFSAQRTGQVTVGGLVAGSYQVRAHFVDPGTGATLTSAVRTVRLVPPPADSVPVSFEQNVGQTDSQVSYLSRVAGGQAYFTQQGVMLVFYSSTASAPNSSTGPDQTTTTTTVSPGQLPGGPGSPPPPPVMETAERVQFQGGNPNPQITAENRQANVTNYLIGGDPTQWHTGVPNFGQVTYHAIYPGIDAVFHGGAGNGLEFDFQLAPGADPGQIALSFPDLDGVTVTPDGQLQLTTATGTITVAAPVAYQTVSGVGTVAVPSGFAVRGTNQVGLTVGPYNHSLPLIVDPLIQGATYLGGGQNDELAGNGPPIITPTDSAMTSDGGGSIFLTGSTNSTNYPTTTGVFQATNKGGTTDAFVTKMNGQGTALAWSTYLGGGGADVGYGITVDSGDDPYVVGGTTSTDFPTTAGVFQGSNKASGGGKNAFVTKLNAQGTALVYSTYLGGGTDAQMNSIAVDTGGDAYVTGTGGHDYPTTPGAFRATSPGPGSINDGVLTKLNAQGTALVYSTFYSGFFASTPSQVLVDSLGQAVIGGSSFSSDLPMTPGSFQTTYGSGSLSNGFIAKFNAAGSNLLWATYIGGTHTDYVESITGDTSGDIYGTGYELFTGGGFPTTAGAFQTSPKGGQEAFAFKISPDGRSLVYSTYLGGSKDDRGMGIAVDGFGNAYVTGTTLSNDFPTSGNALQATNKGGILSGDAFLVQLNSVGTAVPFGTYLGGTKDDWGLSVNLGPTLLNLAGTTSSTDFPVVTGAFQSTNAGGDDVWVSAVNQLVPPGGFTLGFAASAATTGSGPGAGGGGFGGSTNGLADDRFERNDTSDQATNLGAFGPATVNYTGLTINLHTDGTDDQDWYQITTTQAGTLSVSVNHIASGGDLWLRLFKVNSNGTLLEIGNSTLTGGVTTQLASVTVNAGDQIDIWVFGFNFALGFYDLGMSLA